MTHTEKVALAMAWYDSGLEDRAAFQTLMESLFVQPEQEPVAWQFFQGGKWHNGMEFHDHRKHTIAAGTPVRDLYTSPPQRTWIGLTGLDQKKLMAMSARDAVFATEAKLKQKNGYAEEKNT